MAEEDSFTRCEDLGNKLIEAEHPNSDSIKDKLAELAREKAALFALWDERKLIYSQCIEYQIFCRDVEQTEAWLAKQEVRISIRYALLMQLCMNALGYIYSF